MVFICQVDLSWEWVFNPKCNVVSPIHSDTVLLSKDQLFATVEERVLLLSGDPFETFMMVNLKATFK